MNFHMSCRSSMPEGDLYPLEAIAQVLNITPRHVQRLAKAGILPPASQGRYQLTGCIQGYTHYLQEKIEHRAPDALTMEKQKLLHERCRRLKRQNDELEASLIPADEAMTAMLEMAATFDACAEALYAPKLLDELAGMDEPAVVRARLKEAVRACRQDVADRLEKRCEQGSGERYPH
jgi:hypothetical protein